MILWLLACTGSPEANKDADRTNAPAAQHDTGETPLPSIDDTELEPNWTTEQVGSRLSEAMGNMPNPAEAFDTYVDLMSRGDPVCPGSEQIIVDTWLYGCDASTGYSYAGVTDWLTGEYDVMGQPMPLSGIAGDFWIDTPEGDRLEGGGNAVVLTDGSVWIGDFTGSWRYTGGSDWFAYGFSGRIALQIIPGLFVQAEGAIDVMGTHLAMHELYLFETCDGGAQGAVSLRDPNGGWYRLQFEECTPCGELTFEDTPMGEGCVDFAPFLERVRGWP